MKGLKDRHVITETGEFPRAGQTCGPATRDRDLDAVLFDLRDRLRHLFHGVIGHKALETSDRHRLALLAPDTKDLALGLLGTDPPADGRQAILLDQKAVGFFEIALAHFFDEL